MWLPALAILIALRAIPAHAGPVRSCGTIVKGVGELVGDLDCSGYAGSAVSVDGTLKLNGHTLTGYADSTSPYVTVNCNPLIRGCKIEGPGTISGGGIGVLGNYVRLTDVTVSGAGTGVEASRARIRSCKIIGNGQVVPANLGSLDGGGITVGWRLVMSDSTVTGNGFYGVAGHGEINAGIALKRSTITGNGNVPAYCAHPPVSCGDVVTLFDIPVRARATTCDISHRGNSGATLGICSGD